MTDANRPFQWRHSFGAIACLSLLVSFVWHTAANANDMRAHVSATICYVRDWDDTRLQAYWAGQTLPRNTSLAWRQLASHDGHQPQPVTKSDASKRITTTVSVPDGGQLIIGGRIHIRRSFTHRKAHEAIDRQTTTLMMTVTPRIIIPEEEEELLVRPARKPEPNGSGGGYEAATPIPSPE